MIEHIEISDGKVIMGISTKNKKNLSILFQEDIYRPTVDKRKLLQQKILGFRKNKAFLEIKEMLKKEYYISFTEESPYFYYDVVLSDFYKVVWRKQRYNEVEVPIGTTLYHLTKEYYVEQILENGLTPTMYSEDGVFYGCNKVFLLTQPIHSENEPYIDGHLRNRIQLEIEYDGSFKLYKDHEYNHHKTHPMVYAITDTPVKVKGISEIQPIAYK